MMVNWLTAWCIAVCMWHKLACVLGTAPPFQGAPCRWCGLFRCVYSSCSWQKGREDIAAMYTEEALLVQPVAGLARRSVCLTTRGCLVSRVQHAIRHCSFTQAGPTNNNCMHACRLAVFGRQSTTRSQSTYGSSTMYAALHIVHHLGMMPDPE